MENLYRKMLLACSWRIVNLELGIKQPTVAGMEKPGRDLKLSTLKRYVEAAGGKLRLDVELPDGSHYGFVL
ncbi:hypothetical protein SOASR031_14320 [Leminorella grimontii]|nr:hypothetical protein SOASR031_14320 [Leminorella grimontii]